MKKVIVIAIISLCLLGAGVGLGTYAWFTSQATAGENVFQTGELIIGVPNVGENDGFINIRNLFPGQSSTASLDVKNLGDVLFKYKVSSVRADGDETLYNKLDLSIDSGDTNIYKGPLKDINTVVGNIDAKGVQTLVFTIKLLENAGNECQGKIASAKFIFDATQVENTAWVQ